MIDKTDKQVETYGMGTNNKKAILSDLLNGLNDRCYRPYSDEKDVQTTIKSFTDTTEFCKDMAKEMGISKSSFINLALKALMLETTNPAKFDLILKHKRFMNVFKEHGYSDREIVRELGKFGVVAEDISSYISLLEKLNNDVLDYVANKFKVNKSWLQGLDDKKEVMSKECLNNNLSLDAFIKEQISIDSIEDNQEPIITISGEAGSGKTNLVKEISHNAIGKGNQVFIFDCFREYTQFSKQVDGNEINFCNEDDFCINPFSTVKSPDVFVNQIEYGKYLDKALSNIVDIIVSMVNGISGIESIVKEAVAIAWGEYQQETNITKISEVLNVRFGEAGAEIAAKLVDYAEGGKYCYLFQGKLNIDLRNGLTIFNVCSFVNIQKLQKIVQKCLISHILNENAVIGVPFYIVFDEAWHVLNDSDMAKYLKNISSQIHDNNGIIVLSTQRIGDFYKNAEAQKIFEDSAWKFILSQSLENSGNIFSIKEQNQIDSLTTKRGEYSEFLIIKDGISVIARLNAKQLDDQKISSIKILSTREENYER